MVEGGVMDRITVTNIAMHNVNGSIFMKSGRKKGYRPAVFRNVILSNIIADGIGCWKANTKDAYHKKEHDARIGISITGQEDCIVENVTLDNIHLQFAGGGTEASARRPLTDQRPAGYPEYTNFGVTPAYGINCQYVKGVRFNNIVLDFIREDVRPAFYLQHSEDVNFSAIHAKVSGKAPACIRLVDVNGAFITGCKPRSGKAPFCSLEENARNITLMNNDFGNVESAYVKSAEIPEKAIVCMNNNGKATTMTHTGDRAFWIRSMLKIVDPVFVHLSAHTLKARMPVETRQASDPRNRKAVSHLEALGRAFTGIAPWLNLGADSTAEGRLRGKYIDLCIKAIGNAVDPASADYLRFGGNDRQTLVDAAFLAHGLLRSRDQVWPKFDVETRQRLVEELQSTRQFTPGENNWLLFSAMIEAALLEFTGQCEMKPITYAIARHNEWYKGDGWYGDGQHFHLDYYNSYVIHPMLIDILGVLKEKNIAGSDSLYQTELQRMIRYADQQEKLISPEGTYPALGRSTAYRFGAFQTLAQAALMKKLPEHIMPSQVRAALTRVIGRQLVDGSFDENGWLLTGFCGHQPEIAETYISTGSLYLCAAVFLPLGLSPRDDFWANPSAAWSSQKAWNGNTMVIDRALKDV
jgi:hypothetical protein